MSFSNVLLKIVLIVSIEESTLLLASKAESVEVMVIRHPNYCLEQSVNLTKENDIREGIGVNVAAKENVENDHLNGVEELADEDKYKDKDISDEKDTEEGNLEDEDEEEGEDTFQLVDKRAKALIQPWEVCQHR